MKYKIAIFDMDGTILDTLEDLTDAINHALTQYGFAPHPIENVRKFVGNGLMKLVERAVPEGTGKEDVNRVYDELISYYQLHCADKTKPYDHIVETIVKLRKMGCKTAVVSNKRNEAVSELCETYFKGLFDAAAGEKQGIRRKPSPDSVNQVLTSLGFSTEDAIYIGDSEVDVATAKNAHIPCITVTWGFRDLDYLKEKGAEVFASTPSQIIDLLF